MIYAFINWLAEFVFYYPILMSIVWMVGGIYFFCRRELGKSKTPPELEVTPLVSVFVPAGIQVASQSIDYMSVTVVEKVVEEEPPLEELVE